MKAKANIVGCVSTIQPNVEAIKTSLLCGHILKILRKRASRGSTRNRGKELFETFFGLNVFFVFVFIKII